MKRTPSTADPGRPEKRVTSPVRRRTFIAVSGGVGTSILAGCTDSDSSEGGATVVDESASDDQSDSDDGPTSSGTFRLLVSDRPAAIDDFDRLDVSFDSARVFDGGGDAEDTQGEDSQDGNETEGTEGNESTDDQSDGTETGSEDDDGDGTERRRDFYTLDLDGATVDLTQVVGNRAMSVFEGDLSAGRYEKLELHVAAVDGIVDGELAEVKVPSGKLQITHPFEVRDGESVEFVFDINVVRRGQGNRYNLTPVISESGLAGEDVDVEEVGPSVAGSGSDGSA